MLALAIAALLTLTDPVGDVGDGTVHQPTAATERPNGALDVTQLELYDTAAITFSLSFASLTNPFALSNGFSFPLAEIYIDDHTGTGSTTLLPGSEMRLPGGATWKYAFKLSGDAVQLFEASSNGWQDVTSKFAMTLSVQGTSLVVSSSLPRPKKFDVYGMVGSYTPFNTTGWMPLSRTESPWAYSSETQSKPVIDVIAPTFAAQQIALATGVLPALEPPRATNPWLFVMLGGVLIAVMGVMVRFAPNRTPATSKAIPTYIANERADDEKSVNAVPNSGLSNPGPYQPDPYKSRRLEPETATSQPAEASAEAELTPAQQMAAERAKAIIVGDRIARGGSTADPENTDNLLTPNDVPVAKANLAEANSNEAMLDDLKVDDVTLNLVNLDKAGTDKLNTDKVSLGEVATSLDASAKKPILTLSEDTVSSTAIPLFQTAPKQTLAENAQLTLPPPRATPPESSKSTSSGFTASTLESWHDDTDDTLATFNWNKPEAASEKVEKPRDK
jgi:C-terminal binding-module, SLH-like, of glucodextranase